MDIHFGCTACGNCCRNLKLPLTVSEAVTWLGEGNQIQVICEASPALPTGPEDGVAAYFRGRSFESVSGTMPVQVATLLAANLEGQCRYLRDDLRCGIYDRRPLVCRIYPAEINPFRKLEPAAKACPPEAWSASMPLFQRNGELTGTTLRADIVAAREANVQDRAVKRRACAELGISDTAIAGEGFMIHSPRGDELLAALLRGIAAHPGLPSPSANWRLLSDRPESVRSLAERGARAVSAEETGGSGHPTNHQYIGFRRDRP